MRIQKNMIAKRERVILNWICPRLPGWIMPDHLTLIGLVGALIVLCCQIGSRTNPWFLWLAAFGLVVHWFGDSLDGSVARFRGIERPAYGYFLDHTVDALCNLLIMIGYGSTLYIRMDISLFALIGYYLLCIYVFINNHITGTFQLSFLGMGPTEIRLFLIAINIWMFFSGPNGFEIAKIPVTYYDAVLFFGALTMITLFLLKVWSGVRTLRCPEGFRRVVALETGHQPPVTTSAHQAARDA